MGKEIRKETDWLGREKDVIYEGGKKVGETKHETTFFGTPKDVTYDTKGNKVSETKHETTIFGTSKEVSYDTRGNKISETRYEEGFFGGKKGIIRERGEKIGELKTEKGFFGGRKQVLHESSEDVDLTRRAIRETPMSTTASSYDYQSDRRGSWDKDYVGYNSNIGFKKVLLTVTLIVAGVIGLVKGLTSADKYLNREFYRKAIIAREYGESPHKLVDDKTWGKNSLIKRITQSEESVNYKKERSLFFLESKTNYDELGPELKENLKELAGIMVNKGARFAGITSYFKYTSNVWVAGVFQDGAFICHSPNNGEIWLEQWKYPLKNDILRNIYFLDKDLGISVGRRVLLKTDNGGRKWDVSRFFENGKIREVHIIDRDTYVVKEEVLVSKETRIKQMRLEVPQLYLMSPEVRNEKKVPYERAVYTENGGRSWRETQDWNLKQFQFHIPFTERFRLGDKREDKTISEPKDYKSRIRTPLDIRVNKPINKKETLDIYVY